MIHILNTQYPFYPGRNHNDVRQYDMVRYLSVKVHQLCRIGKANCVTQIIMYIKLYNFMNRCTICKLGKCVLNCQFWIILFLTFFATKWKINNSLMQNVCASKYNLLSAVPVQAIQTLLTMVITFHSLTIEI